MLRFNPWQTATAAVLFSLAFSCVQGVEAQVITGHVSDSSSHSTLPGATVQVLDADGQGLAVALTDLDGRYELDFSNVPKFQSLTLQIGFIGYETHRYQQMFGNDNIVYDVALEESVLRIGTAVISAGRYEQSIEEVSVSIEVLPPALVKQGSTTSADQSLGRTPGVNIVDSEPQIRGGSGYSFGAGSRVAVLLDGMPMLSGDAGRPTWGFLPVENIDQIEVVKGAASVLYGSSALSGVIHFRTAYPGPEPLTRISLQHGAWDSPGDSHQYWEGQRMETALQFLHTRRNAKGDAFVVGGQWLGSDGYKGPEIDAVTGNAHNRPYNPFSVDHYSAEKQLRLNASWDRAPKEGQWGYGIRSNMVSSESLSTMLWANADSGFYNALDGASSRTIQRMITIDPHAERVGDLLTHNVQARVLHLDNNNDNNQGNTSTTFLAEYRVQYHSEHHNITAGGTALHTDSDSELYTAGTGQTIHNVNNAAAYCQVDLKPHKRLNITVGTRYETFQIDTASDGQWVFRSGLNYRLGQGTFLRSSFGQGYRFPTIAEQFISTEVGGITIFPSADLTPEQSWNAEIGLKQGFQFGREGQWKGFLDAAVFMQRFDDYIEYTFGKWGPGTTLEDFGFRSVNTGPAQVRGWEISTAGLGSAGDWTFDWLIGHTHIDPQSLAPDSMYTTFAGTDTGVSFNNTSSNPEGNILKYRIIDGFRMNFRAEHASGWSCGWNASCNTKIQNIDLAFLELDPLIGYGLTDWFEDRPDKMWLHGIQIGKQISPNSNIDLSVRNITNKVYSLRPLAAEPNRMFIVRYTYEI